MDGSEPRKFSATKMQDGLHYVVTDRWQRFSDLATSALRIRLYLRLSCSVMTTETQDGLYYVVTDRWQRFSDLALTPQSIAELAQSADEFLVHGVDVEGMR